MNGGDFVQWAAEALEVSQTVVYPGFENGEDPDQEYRDAATPVILERMMYGGARLAALMVDIYGSEQAYRFLQ